MKGFFYLERLFGKLFWVVGEIFNGFGRSLRKRKIMVKLLSFGI